MLESFIAIIGVVVPTIAGGLYKLAGMNTRLSVLETQQTADEKAVLNKLDSIGEKIDLRCDSLDQRIDRIERKVLNGEYEHYRTTDRSHH